jgi:hypothetical protein
MESVPYVPVEKVARTVAPAPPLPISPPPPPPPLMTAETDLHCAGIVYVYAVARGVEKTVASVKLTSAPEEQS